MRKTIPRVGYGLRVISDGETEELAQAVECGGLVQLCLDQGTGLDLADQILEELGTVNRVLFISDLNLEVPDVLIGGVEEGLHPALADLLLHDSSFQEGFFSL